MNKTQLTGRLTTDPELKSTQSGTSTVTVNLAVNRRLPNKQTGEREADFIRCVFWGKTAEALANYAHKGSLIGVSGEIRTGSYENNQGTRIYTTDVWVQEMDFLESRSSQQQQEAPGIPRMEPNGQIHEGRAMEINDDDLPF
jgi:single-strand DNA-binding protein